MEEVGGAPDLVDKIMAVAYVVKDEVLGKGSDNEAPPEGLTVTEGVIKKKKRNLKQGRSYGNAREQSLQNTSSNAAAGGGLEIAEYGLCATAEEHVEAWNTYKKLPNYQATSAAAFKLVGQADSSLKKQTTGTAAGNNPGTTENNNPTRGALGIDGNTNTTQNDVGNNDIGIHTTVGNDGSSSSTASDKSLGDNASDSMSLRGVEKPLRVGGCILAGTEHALSGDASVLERMLSASPVVQQNNNAMRNPCRVGPTSVTDVRMLDGVTVPANVPSNSISTYAAIQKNLIMSSTSTTSSNNYSNNLVPTTTTVTTSCATGTDGKVGGDSDDSTPNSSSSRAESGTSGTTSSSAQLQSSEADSFSSGARDAKELSTSNSMCQRTSSKGAVSGSDAGAAYRRACATTAGSNNNSVERSRKNKRSTSREINTERGNSTRRSGSTSRSGRLPTHHPSSGAVTAKEEREEMKPEDKGYYGLMKTSINTLWQKTGGATKFNTVSTAATDNNTSTNQEQDVKQEGTDVEGLSITDSRNCQQGVQNPNGGGNTNQQEASQMNKSHLNYPMKNFGGNQFLDLSTDGTSTTAGGITSSMMSGLSSSMSALASDMVSQCD